MLCFTASGFARTSMPPTMADPEVGASRPQRMRIVVDFPAPFGPKKPKISPGFTRSETWSTATKSPNRLTRFSIATANSDGCMALLRFADECNEHVFERWLDSLKRLHREAHRLHLVLDGGGRSAALQQHMQRRAGGF